MKYGWSSPSASSNMSSRNTPSYRPAAAMLETWWKCPASMALANSTALRVPSMLTWTWLSSSADRSYTAARWYMWSMWPLSRFRSSAATPSFLDVRSPYTGTARALLTPQNSSSAATLSSLSGRSRKWTTAPLRASKVLTRRLPMKPVAPVTKYCMRFSFGWGAGQCRAPKESFFPQSRCVPLRAYPKSAHRCVSAGHRAPSLEKGVRRRRRRSYSCPTRAARIAHWPTPCDDKGHPMVKKLQKMAEKKSASASRLLDSQLAQFGQGIGAADLAGRHGRLLQGPGRRRQGVRGAGQGRRQPAAQDAGPGRRAHQRRHRQDDRDGRRHEQQGRRRSGTSSSRSSKSAWPRR